MRFGECQTEIPTIHWKYFGYGLSNEWKGKPFNIRKIWTFCPGVCLYMWISYRNKKSPFFHFYFPLVLFSPFFIRFQPSKHPFTILSVGQFVCYICILLFLMYQNYNPIAFVMDIKEPFLNYSAYSFMMIALFYCK